MNRIGADLFSAAPHPAEAIQELKAIAVPGKSLLASLAGAAATGGLTISRYRDGTPRNLTPFAIAMPEGEFHPASFNSRVGISRERSRIAFNTFSANVVVLGWGGELSLSKA